MEEFYINSDGIRRHAKLDRPENLSEGPLCILVHGFTGNMEEDHIVAAKNVMTDLGVSVLRVEMYGHGMSDGEFRDHTLFKWMTNVLDVVSYARKLDFVTDLYMCGHSQGGLLTMLTGALCPDDFRAIIPLSPAWMIPEYARKGIVLGNEFDPDHIPEMVSNDAWNLSGDYIRVAQNIFVEDIMTRYKGRVLIIHGDEDETVPYSYAEKAVKLYDNAELIPVHGANHCFVGNLDELSDALRSFFSSELL